MEAIGSIVQSQPGVHESLSQTTLTAYPEKRTLAAYTSSSSSSKNKRLNSKQQMQRSPKKRTELLFQFRSKASLPPMCLNDLKNGSSCFGHRHKYSALNSTKLQNHEQNKIANFIKTYFIFIVCVWGACASVHICADGRGGQKRVSDPPVLELLVAVSYLICALETELRSSARAVSPLNH